MVQRMLRGPKTSIEKMRAIGWNVIDILDGHSNVASIANALLSARRSDKPTFINIHTAIGFGSLKAGNAATHGAALGVEDICTLKEKFGLNPEEHFVISHEAYSFFEDVAPEENNSKVVGGLQSKHMERHIQSSPPNSSFEYPARCLLTGQS